MSLSIVNQICQTKKNMFISLHIVRRVRKHLDLDYSMSYTNRSIYALSC